MLPISSRCHQSGVLVRGFFPARACGDTGDIEQRDLLPAQGDVQEARVGQVQGILRKFSAFWESSMHFGKTQGLSGKAQFLLGRVSAFGKVLWLLCRLSAFWGGSVPFREAQCVSGRLGAARSGSVRARRCSPGREGAPAELCYHLPGTAGCWAALGPGGLRAVEGNLYPPLGLIPKPERHVGPDPSRGSQAQPATIMGLLPHPFGLILIGHKHQESKEVVY